MTEGQAAPAEADLTVSAQIVRTADGDGNDGRERGGESGSWKSHLQRKHENIVEHNIERASCEGGNHGDRGSVIVSRKCRERIIGHEEGGRNQYDAQIGTSQPDQLRVRTEDPENLFREEDASGYKDQADQHAPGDRLEEVVIRRLFSGMINGISGSGTDPDHGADREEQSVDWKHEIQHRETVGTGADRDEEGISKNIDRKTKHSGNTLQNIFEKCFIHGNENPFLKSILSCVRMKMIVLPQTDPG